jgi:hypothetical protein
MAGVAQLHYDEEDCLGLELFAAELELLLATRDRRPDQTQLLELLQKLQTSISGAEPAVVKRCQKRCEGALADVLRKGACSVVSLGVCGPSTPAGHELVGPIGVGVIGVDC